MKVAVAILIACGLSIGSSAQRREGASGVGAEIPLTLTLSQDLRGLSESSGFQACLQEYPQVACIPLIATLRNNGRQMITRWFTSCPGDFPGVKLKMPNGQWELLPNEPYPYLCPRNMLTGESLAPGETKVVRFRLADPALNLNLKYPPNDGLIHVQDRYINLLASRPSLIQAQWHINACASKKFNSKKSREPFPCLGRAKVQQFATVVYSNEVNLQVDVHAGWEPDRAKFFNP